MTRHDDSRTDGLRIPPQSIDAEQAVIGGLMLAPDAFDRIADRLSEEDFYRRDHQLIYRAIQELADKSKPYDAVTMGEWFESQGLSEQIAGGAYLVELANTTPSAANIIAYAEIVREKAILRKLIEAGTGIVNDAFQPEGRDTQELLAAAQQSVSDIGIENDSGGLRMVRSTAREVWADLVKDSQQTGKRETPTPHHGVNEVLMPFQPEDVITLAALTSVGKTVYAMEIAEHYAGAHKKHVAVFSLEMSPRQLVLRTAAKRARVDSMRLSSPENLTDEEWGSLNAAIKEISLLPIAIDDSAGIGLRELRARAKRMHRAVPGGLGLIVIDYLQLMDTPNKDSREQGVSAVSRGVKRLAKELKVPILQLSQLNRKSEERGYPILADLRESGSIEQDSDTVVFLHLEGSATILTVAKQRRGQRNVRRKLASELQHYRFRDWDPERDDPLPADVQDKPKPVPRTSGFGKRSKPAASPRDAAAGE